MVAFPRLDAQNTPWSLQIVLTSVQYKHTTYSRTSHPTIDSCKTSGHDLGKAMELPDDAFFSSFVANQRVVSTAPQSVLDEIREQRTFAEASLGKSCGNSGLLQYLQNDRSETCKPPLSVSKHFPVGQRQSTASR